MTVDAGELFDLTGGDDPSPRPARRPRRWRRALARLLVALLVLHAALLVAASWYYSSRIESDALRVRQPGPWQEALTVTAVDPAAGTITMTAKSGPYAADVTSQLASPTVYGLHWKGGFAQSRSAGALHEGALTRHATLLEGTWPAVGTSIGAHTFAWPQGIEAPWTEVTFPGPDGPLSGWFSPASVPGGGSGTWAVMVHGKGAEPDEFDRIMPTFVRAGVPTLAIHYRGDPGMPPEPDDRYGFGATEWPDLAAAVDHARAQGATRVVLVGASMGGAIVASYLRHAKDTDIVTGVLLDSPVLSFAETVQWGADQIALPGGLGLPAPVTWGAQRLTTWRFGVDWEAADFLDDTSWDRPPTLVFHGTRDRTVPVTTSRELAATRANVTLVEVPEADHVEAWNVDPAAYESTVREFLAPLLLHD